MRFLTFYLVVLLNLGFFSNTLYAHYLSKKTFVVVLDAGHGGHDSGNRGNGYYEKTIALMNTQLSGLETIFMLSDNKYSFLASSIIRELYMNGSDISKFVTNAHKLN